LALLGATAASAVLCRGSRRTADTARLGSPRSAVPDSTDFLQPPSCDPDGNPTRDDTFKYARDAENRLACAHTGELQHPQNGDWRLEFKYDYMGRRVEKRAQL
jgi:hypothetical protein